MEWKLRHMENTSYCEGKNKVWIWIVHSLWDPQHFPEWNLDFHSLKREISQLSPKTSFHWTRGNRSETVVVRLKQWSLYVTTVPWNLSDTISVACRTMSKHLSLESKTTHHQTFCPSVPRLPQTTLKPPHTSACFLSMSRLACLKVLTCWQKEPSLI